MYRPTQNLPKLPVSSVKRTLSTAEFAKALDISESSVRRLADAGALEIHRTRGGHRRIPISEAVRYIRETRAAVASPELLGLARESIDEGNESVNEKMVSVLEAGHAASVIRLMQWLYASGMSIAELCDGPLAFAMREIGSRWPHDKRAIFVEHRATMMCIRALNQLRLSVPDPDEDAPEAIGAAMSGDMYLLPTLIASLVLHESGFNDTNLGPNTPLEVLADAVLDENPDLLWLSIGEPVRSNSQLTEIVRLAEVARENETTFVIGGRHTEELRSAQTDATGEPRWIHCQRMADLHKLAVTFT
jgi:excisionase family DNA binding protein